MIAVSLLCLLLFERAISQIPNPSQYRFSVVEQGKITERYAIDNVGGRMTRMWFSYAGPQGSGGYQDTWVKVDGRTYRFDYTSNPAQCYGDPGGPYQSMQYWPKIVAQFGGASQSANRTVFDIDCEGACLLWSISRVIPEMPEYLFEDRLYVKISEQKPIKITTLSYNATTKRFLNESVTQLANWSTDPVPDYEFSYPMDLKTCYFH